MPSENLKEGLARHAGAVDLDECPDRLWSSTRLSCRCGACVVCGCQKHTAIHGPVDGGSKGSKPFGHEFTVREENQDAI